MVFRQSIQLFSVTVNATFHSEKDCLLSADGARVTHQTSGGGKADRFYQISLVKARR